MSAPVVDPKRAETQINQRLSLRKPQSESLRRLADIVDLIAPSKETDIEAAREAIRAAYGDLDDAFFEDFERDFPSVCFALATGVGKTRLMPNPTTLRFGFQKAWDRLQAEFEGFALFNLPVGMKADPSLRQPETFRRLPGGMRLNDKDNHLFGVPVGEPLFQGLLWEYLKLERGGGGKATLLDPADFMALPVARPRGQAPKSTPSSMDGGSEVDAYACQKLAALFDGTTAHPRFSHLDRSSGAPVAHFYNHPSDQHPTSVMRDAFATVLIQGSNPLGLTNDATSGGLLMSRLPHPLETMLEIWAGEYQCEQMGPGGRMRSSKSQSRSHGRHR